MTNDMKKIYYLIAMAFAALTFTSCEDVPAPYGDPTNPNATTVVAPAGSGTADDPFNIAGAIAKCKEIGGTVSSEKYYVKGYAATAATADGQYGNVSFDMTDSKDGKGKKFKAYQVAGSDGQKLAEGYTINVGDEVVIYGPMYNYNNTTPETAGKAVAYIVTVNGEKTNGGGGGDAGDPKGKGTEDDPFNIAAAIAKCKEVGETASSEKFYIKGIAVSEGKASGGYGNVSFDMADTADGTVKFKAFQVAGSDGQKLPDGFTVSKGSEVVIYGPVVNYKGDTPETSGKSAAYIVTIDGKKTDGSGGGESGGEVKTVSIADFNAAAVSNDVWYQLTGKVKNLKDGDKYGNFDLEDATGSVYVYGLLSEKGGAKQKFQELVAEKGIAEGSTITIIGNRGDYNGKIEVLNAYFVSIEGGGEPGPSGETLGTKDAPLNIAQALELINALADKAESEQYAYVKGKVVKVTTNQANFEKYGNLNYLISEDGTENNTITVYSGDGLNGAKFTGITDLSAGDEVIVYGKLYKYVNSSGKVTPEINSGNYLVSLVKAGGGGGGGGGTANTGTLANPLTASQIYDAVAAMEKGVTSTEDYYAKGKICSIKYEYSVDYGTATFNISNDGATGGKEFIAYSTYYHASEQKWVEGDTQVAVGDEVVVCGKVVNYNGNTPEFASKKSYVVTINGK
jgi:hypothetical protein